MSEYVSIISIRMFLRAMTTQKDNCSESSDTEINNIS